MKSFINGFQTPQQQEIHAGIARVTLVQYFQNPYDEPLEATYLLPLPSNDTRWRERLTASSGEATK